MEILITLCARGGSKGIPGKNIRPINGRPLIAVSIDVAKAFAANHNADVALSTDSDQIKTVAAQYGIDTPYTRPAELATDTAGKIGVIKDLLAFEEQRKNKVYDFVLDLDITSPLRSLEDLESGFDIISKDENALNLFSVNHANRNPYFNMVEQQPDGYYGLIKKGEFLTRQSAPPVYDLNASFYFYRRAYFEMNQVTTINSRSLIYVMPHICFDLDHPLDFDFMEYLVANNKIDFNLS
ncbi:MAG: acylneuraminate cytidylyltransferase family protein [Sediminibacterium sp.]